MEALISTTGGSLASTDGRVAIDIPTDTFTGTVRLVQGPANGMPAPAGLISTGQVFDITAAYDASGKPAQPAPGKSYTITVTYPDDVPVLEDALALYYWNGNRWVMDDTSSVDVTTNTITAHPTHCSIWAVMGQARPLYLSLMQIR